MQKQLSLKIRQNGKKRICLYVSGSTPVVIEPLVELRGTSSFIRDNFGAIKGKRTSYYVGKDTNSKHNNNQLNNLLEKLEEIVSVNPELTTPKQIVDVYSGKDIKPKQEQEEPETLNTFLQKRIDFIHDTEKSSNYKNYVTAKNSIAKVYPELSKKLLKDVSNADMEELKEKLLAQAPTAFTKTMKIFQAIINKAIEKEKNCNKFIWNWKKRQSTKKEQSHQYINNEVLNNIFTIDIDSIRGKMSYQKCKMYLDIVKLQYHTASRPVDTIQFNINNVKGETWVYIPAKKANLSDGQEAQAPIKYEAQQIINEYKENANNLNGYIFPVTSNVRKYPNNIKRGDERNKIEREINLLLKKIGEKVGIKKLTMYDFRKTRITNLVKENNIPIPMIALMAGTSEKMIYKHYLSKESIYESFIKFF